MFTKRNGDAVILADRRKSSDRELLQRLASRKAHDTTRRDTEKKIFMVRTGAMNDRSRLPVQLFSETSRCLFIYIILFDPTATHTLSLRTNKCFTCILISPSTLFTNLRAFKSSVKYDVCHVSKSIFNKSQFIKL